MASSDGRRLLSLMIATFGVDGTLVVPKGGLTPESDLASEGPDLVPGSALRWPPCRCGGSTCPDAGGQDRGPDSPDGTAAG
ncbi:hypothetical protein PUR57_36890 [Streptomyces sp. JV176]|uniref:hypothetical protein n=1 Tax=Streptomyces sp. JV176 TaxID=858630 RepID=UPI002E769F8B|nr:hypothetical protein [Streptomyces sp. JV176]MEE1804191.1 hypothetical protein [Streptomyces sp. JV176]